MASEMRIELIQVPVSDIDRAKAFYVEKVGFTADHDHQVSDELRFVQLTPPAPPARSRSPRVRTRWLPGPSRGCRW